MKDLKIKLKTCGDSSEMSAIDLERKRNWLKAHQNGSDVIMTLSEVKAPKSNAQVRAFWGLFIKTCMEHFQEHYTDTTELLRLLIKFLIENRPSGCEITESFLKETMYLLNPMYDDDGKRITLSHIMADKAKVAEFYDNCCNLVAAIWGIYVPEPQKDWRDKNDT